MFTTNNAHFQSQNIDFDEDRYIESAVSCLKKDGIHDIIIECVETCLNNYSIMDKSDLLELTEVGITSILESGKKLEADSYSNYEDFLSVLFDSITKNKPLVEGLNISLTALLEYEISNLSNELQTEVYKDYLINSDKINLVISTFTNMTVTKAMKDAEFFNELYKFVDEAKKELTVEKDD